MIVYFSGTGNSEYTARRIGEKIGDRVTNLFEKIRQRDFSPMASKAPWVVVVPTYAWRIPRIVEEWLKNTGLEGNKNIYFVMTCGGSIGNAGKYLEKLCVSKNLCYRGCAEIVMPENYIALFSAPPKEQALEIIRRADGVIDEAAGLIQSGKAFSKREPTFQDKLNSGMVNQVYYPLFVHAGQFNATVACVSCGKCARVCPLHNIRLENGRPLWGKSCTHCMACICRCPTRAIEYGKHTKGLIRYVCPASDED